MVVSIRRNPNDVNRRRFFGSARTILLVRFDDGSTDSFDPNEIRDEAEPDQFLAARRKREFRKLVGISQATGPKAFSRSDFRAAVTAARINLADAVAKLPRPDGLTRVIDVQPLKSTRRVNTYRKADELDLTFSWSSMPFDSRLIRAILVFHYEGTVPADAWGTGVRESAPGSATPSGYLVPASGSNLRFVGTIDEIADAHGAGDVLTMKGRDLTSLFIDTKYSPKLEVRIPAGATIIEAVQAVLETNDLFELVRGPFLLSDTDPPALDPSRYPRLAVPAKERHRQDKTGGRGFVLRRPPKGGGKSSYWDILTDLCFSHGLRPSIEGDKLVLLEPRQLYKRTPEIITQPGVPRFPTTYRTRIGDTFPIRRMVYGSNVAALRFHRKLGRIKAPAIEVSSYNPDAERADERLIVVRHPPKTRSGRRANDVDATGKKPQEKVHPVQLHGIIDKEQLKLVAEQIYEGMGRQELGVVIETDDLASFSDNPQFDPNEDPDLLAIRAGDPVRVLVMPTQANSSKLFTLSELQGLVERAKQLARATGARAEYSSAVAYLVGQGWRRDDARQFVRVLSSANLPQEFRVVGASISFDGESDKGGFNFQLDCRDYVRARADPEDISQTRALDGAVPGDPSGEVVV